VTWTRGQGYLLAAILSTALWAIIIWAFLVATGCAARVGEGGSVTYSERVKVERPPKEWDATCPQGQPLKCCCDLSRDGVISCRCPHPGGVQ
jgi:hypothetical protein